MTLMTLIVREYENQEKPISFEPPGLIKQERWNVPLVLAFYV